MLKRNSKAMAIVITLFFCFAFVAPAFVSPDVAQAAGTYRALSEPVVGPSDTTNLGVIEIDFPSGAEIAAGDVLTVSFPSNVKSTAPGAGIGVQIVTSDIAAAEVYVVVPGDHPQTGKLNGLQAGDMHANISGTSQSMNITFDRSGNFARSVIYVYLKNMALNGASGDLTAQILGSTSAIPLGSVVVGKVSTETGTMATIKGVKAIGTAATQLEPITLIETKKNSLVSGEVVKIKLPAGFKWIPGGGAVAGWAFSGPISASPDVDNRILNITVNGSAGGNTTTGKIDVVGIIQADDSVAKKGDVIAQIYSDQGNVTSQDLTVAKYGTYAANGEEGTVAELIAGKAEQKLGTFYVAEELPGSLVPGRTIKLTLPVGVKWWGGYRTGSENFPAVVLDKGNNIINNCSFTVATNTNNSSDEGRTITLTLTIANPVANGSQVSTSAAKIKFKDFKVDVSPEFTGDVKVTVGGTAGATGEVKVATAISPVEMSVENTTKIRIGEQKQAAGNLVIKETKKDNIRFRNTKAWKNDSTDVTNAENNRSINLTLPLGAQWAELPKVEVTEGDLQLDVNNMSKGSSVINGSDNRVVTIPVKSSSMTASTVKVSDILVTLDRTVPEGNFKISVGGLAINEVGIVFPNDSLPGQVVSTVVTPAPAEGTDGAASGIFRIDSNIYEVNGVSKVMDASPYIKANRTYVPVRYLAYALGVLEADVVWDEATQKVTLTKGDDVVELTIGSTTITVNGEAQTMDVAPEITKNRTMLPARYVAEGLGYVVGWDPGTRTVLISK